MLIEKYGITIGDKLAEGIIEIGMTKDMVVDALGYDDIVLHSYRISNSMDWSIFFPAPMYGMSASCSVESVSRSPVSP